MPMTPSETAFLNEYDRVDHQQQRIKDLFTITCLAQFLSEQEDYRKNIAIDLTDHIEEAAMLFFMAHGVVPIHSIEKDADKAVKEIRKIWDEHGEWPDKYRF